MSLLENNAEEAVELLKIEDFLNAHIEKIFDRLEQYDHRVLELETQGEIEGEVIFVAESLPLISGVINVGSSRESFDEACEWVRNKFPGHEPVPLLSALTFVYIVNEKWSKFEQAGSTMPKEEAEKKEIWERIHDRVQKMAHGQQ